jgi:hypothetical protein
MQSKEKRSLVLLHLAKQLLEETPEVIRNLIDVATGESPMSDQECEEFLLHIGEFFYSLLVATAHDLGLPTCEEASSDRMLEDPEGLMQ